MTHTFRANGKLLLSGEYTVLDGAKALAIPTKLGQTLTVTQEDSNQRKLSWKSFNHDGTLWFEVLFDKNLQVIHANQLNVAERLQKLLVMAVQANPSFYAESNWYEVETCLEFNREWGLGSSSTLVSLVAQWAKVDAFELVQNTFGGSGYDVMCATAKHPITFQLVNSRPVVEHAEFNPVFKERLWFYYTGNKQYSNKEVTRYRELDFDRVKAVEQINRLTDGFLNCSSIQEFQSIVDEHENLMSKLLGMPKAKELILPTYKGSVKSLGAWGGDFVLLAGESIANAIPFCDMIFSES